MMHTRETDLDTLYRAVASRVACVGSITAPNFAVTAVALANAHSSGSKVPQARTTHGWAHATVLPALRCARTALREREALPPGFHATRTAA